MPFLRLANLAIVVRPQSAGHGGTSSGADAAAVAAGAAATVADGASGAVVAAAAAPSHPPMLADGVVCARMSVSAVAAGCGGNCGAVAVAAGAAAVAAGAAVVLVSIFPGMKMAPPVSVVTIVKPAGLGVAARLGFHGAGVGD